MTFTAASCLVLILGQVRQDYQRTRFLAFSMGFYRQSQLRTTTFASPINLYEQISRNCSDYLEFFQNYLIMLKRFLPNVRWCPTRVIETNQNYLSCMLFSSINIFSKLCYLQSLGFKNDKNEFFIINYHLNIFSQKGMRRNNHAFSPDSIEFFKK